MSAIKFKCLKHQAELLRDTATKFIALVAGYGAGKSVAACYKALSLASINLGCRSVVLEPTHSMAVDVIIPTLVEILDSHNIAYTYRASPLPSFMIHFEDGDHEILIRSAENYRRLAGLNLAFFVADEFDTIPKKLALQIFRMLQSRLRKGHVRQGIITTTPEGYKATYELFVMNEGPDRRLIKARTQDNPYLPPDYIQNLLDTYPANLIKAYLDGEFINMTTGSVYTNYDRNAHDTPMTVNTIQNAILHLGLDFNVGNMTAVVMVVKDNNPYAVGEITKLRDTNEMILALKRKYPNKMIYIYPDASGNSNKTSASKTDIAQLQHAGFKVFAPNKNPSVRDRINSVQAMLKDGNGNIRLRVNARECPILAESLEKQAYTEKGEPDKTAGFDHPNDALGYFIHFHYPLLHNKGTQIINAA